MKTLFFFWKVLWGFILTHEIRVGIVCPHGHYDINEQGKVASAGMKPDTGGQTVFCWELFGWLSRIPFVKVDLFHRMHGRKPEIFVHSRFPNLRIVRIKCGPKGFVRKEDLYGPTLDEFVENMLGFIRENGLKYSFFHGHYADGGYVAGKVAMSLGVLFYFTFHSLGAGKKSRMEKAGDLQEDVLAMNFKARIKVEKWILKNADCVFSTYPREKDDIRDLYGMVPKMILPVFPGFNDKIFFPLESPEERPGWLPEKYVVMAPGRLEKAKGHHLLLKAWKHVASKHPDVKLVIIGGNPDPDKLKGKDREHLLKMLSIIEENNLRGKILHLGAMSQGEILGILRHALAYVSPAGFEPFGMTLIEAAAIGLPCVFSEKAGASQLFEDWKSSLKINPFDEVTLGGAISRLIEDQDFAIKLGKEAAKVAASLTWKGQAKRQFAAYFGIKV